VKAVAIANSDEYSAFILGDNGRVYAVGRNNTGQLGDGTTTDRSTPVEVKIPRQETIY
jgi:alpha-tubulin suppressor-like RCC1 family protein